MLICAIPKEMYIVVPRCKTALNVSGFFLATAHSYCTKGGWNFKAKVC
jgi:hypothetical protein